MMTEMSCGHWPRKYIIMMFHAQFAILTETAVPTYTHRHEEIEALCKVYLNCLYEPRVLSSPHTNTIIHINT
jgi:hypothetical protein